MSATATPRLKTKKILVRRWVSGSTRRLRSVIQFAFFLLNVLIAVQFYVFVRQFETVGAASVTRPAGVEGWLPIAGLMNLKTFLLTGQVPSLHPATLFLITAFLSMSFLLRKAFCSWLCPIGTLSEWLWKAGRSIFRRNFRLPRWLDIPLRSLKYLLLALFVYVVAAMSVESIRAFLHSPYGIVADVKMLNLFRYMSTTTAIVMGVLLITSVFIQNFWCRYLCPYGALMGLASMLSPIRIRRTEALCIDCAKCAKACPSQLPVDKLVSIRSAECLGCMECVNVCPAEGALDMKVLARKRVQPWMIAAGVGVIFIGLVGYAKISGHWDTYVPNAVYRHLIPNAREYAHP